ncbi:hypothetical protein [Desulfocurvus sp. DL9XJH121]
MGKQRRYDWEKIESEYRAGQKSIRQLAAEFGPAESTIRKRITREGWTQDLTEPVRQRVREKIARDAVAEESRDQADQAAVIEAAGERGAGLVREHQVMLSRLRRTGLRLIEEVERNLLVEDENGELKAVQVDLLKSLAMVHARATTSICRVIPLERKAFNLDDDDGTGEHEASLEDLE